MPPLAAAIPFITAAAAVGTAAAGVISAVKGNSAGKQGSGQGDQRGLESSLSDRRNNEESQQRLTDTRNAARLRQQNLAVGAGGRQDSILTGPLGVTGNPSGQQKTLLGT